MSRKLLENAATVIACSTAWDTARTIDTLLLSGRIHVPSDIMLFTSGVLLGCRVMCHRLKQKYGISVGRSVNGGSSHFV